MLKTGLFVLLAYLAFTTLVFLMQRKMLYLPIGGQLTAAQAQARGLQHWPSSEDFKGFLGEPASDTPRGTVVVFHGNAGSAGDRGFYVNALTPLGWRVLLAEYPGYGGRPGKPTEQALVADATALIARVREAFDEPVVLLGESLGCSVASAVAAEPDSGIRHLVMITPWDSLADVAQTHYWYLPARWLVLDRFDNVRNLRAFDGRLAMVLAEHDEVIPTHHGQALFDSAVADKKLWVLSGAQHNTWPAGAKEYWWREVFTFVSDR